MPDADDAHAPVAAKSSPAAVTESPKATGKPAPAAGAAGRSGDAAAAGQAPPTNKLRRRIIWSCIWAYLLGNFLMFLRFFFPRTLFEPTTVFRIGYPSDFALGVNEKYKQAARIWVIKEATRLYVIYARCVHLGCTPDWKPNDNKFKCPCHGSGYHKNGINFEGPTPRPLERLKIILSDEGQILVDRNIKFLYEKQEWLKPDAYLKYG